MIAWNEFATLNQSLSEIGEKLLFQYGVGLGFLATVRPDGAPRLHPVCPVISNSHLYVLIRPDSPKRWDLQRDGRYALQSFPEARPDSDEFYISGRAEAITDPALFDAVIVDAKHHASRDEILFELLMDRAMHTKWEGFGTDQFRPVRAKWSSVR